MCNVVLESDAIHATISKQSFVFLTMRHIQKHGFRLPNNRKFDLYERNLSRIPFGPPPPEETPQPSDSCSQESFSSAPHIT